MSAAMREANASHEESHLANKLRSFEEKCRRCHPLSPISCVTTCDVWKARNEYRKLNRKISNPAFPIMLMNSLKNTRRKQILETVAAKNLTIDDLQKQLQTSGYTHSQDTIAAEYLRPLMDVGLVDESETFYYATDFGVNLAELIRSLEGIEDLLPPHSECQEEKVLNVLLDEPKSFKQLVNNVPAQNLVRVLSRLQRTGLLNENNHDRSYVFFYQSKRDPGNEKLSRTEKRVYESISREGNSAQQLSEIAQISLRRTYKYVRKLKGKKLIFVRYNPKLYSLTTKGVNMAKILRSLSRFVSEAFAVSTTFMTGDHSAFTADVASVSSVEKKQDAVTLLPATTQ